MIKVVECSAHYKDVKLEVIWYNWVIHNHKIAHFCFELVPPESSPAHEVRTTLVIAEVPKDTVGAGTIHTSKHTAGLSTDLA